VIFRQSLLREFSATALGVFVILLAITLTTQFIRFLGQAASGVLVVDAVLAMLGFSALSHLSVLLSLTLFISVLMTLTRSYRDSEMIVWFSSGVSLLRWVRPVLMFSLPMVVTIALLSMFLSPWAVRLSQEYRVQLEARDDVSGVAPGVFRESKQAERVFFVEQVEGDANVVANVFVRSTQQQREGVMVAGVVYNPATDELFTAEKGKGAFLNDRRRLRVAGRKTLADAVVVTGIPHRGRPGHPKFLDEMKSVMMEVAGLRRSGSAALDMAYVAAGRYDGYWERGLKAWDLAAGIVLVREAGGLVTDVTGGDEALTRGNVLAGNKDITKALTPLLAH